MPDHGAPHRISTIASALDLLFDPGRVIEVRALADNCTHSGYFTDTTALARCAEALDTDPAVHGIYVTLTPAMVPTYSTGSTCPTMNLPETS